MRFNRKAFFTGVKERIDPTLSQGQVDGLEFLLGKVEQDPLWKDVRHIAYMLATVFHETAGSFQPVEEGYYLGSKARVKAFQKTLRYYPFFGRGYVQLTHKANYAKAGKAFGVDLVNEPELALTPDIAFKCLGGMFLGWYGAKLTAYINAKKTDYVNARRCVNVLDKAGLIVGYAKSFEKILRSSAAVSTSGSASTAENPTDSSPVSDPQIYPAVEPSPISSTATESVTVAAPAPYQGIGFWAVIKRDLALATGGNLTFEGVSQYAQQASGWPEWVVAIIGKVAVGALVVTLGYFIFRVIHYLVDSWKKNEKAKTEAAANTAPDRFNIDWS